MILAMGQLIHQQTTVVTGHLWEQPGYQGMDSQPHGTKWEPTVASRNQCIFSTNFRDFRSSCSVLGKHQENATRMSIQQNNLNTRDSPFHKICIMGKLRASSSQMMLLHLTLWKQGVPWTCGSCPNKGLRAVIGSRCSVVLPGARPEGPNVTCAEQDDQRRRSTTEILPWSKSDSEPPLLQTKSFRTTNERWFVQPT